MQGGAVGTGAGHALEAQRHQYDQRDGLEAGKENRAPAQDRIAVGEQMHRQQRLPRPTLMPDKQPQDHDRAGEQAQHFGTAPRMALADLGNTQQQGGQADDHQ
ncbi:hypothetical protein D3C84_1138100 [compost metagenome]